MSKRQTTSSTKSTVAFTTTIYGIVRLRKGLKSCFPHCSLRVSPTRMEPGTAMNEPSTWIWRRWTHPINDPISKIQAIRIEPIPTDPVIAQRVQSNQDLGALTFRFPATTGSNNQPDDSEYEMHTEKFRLDQEIYRDSAWRSMGLPIRLDCTYYKDFINQLARV